MNNLRDKVAEEIMLGGYPSDDVAEHAHREAALRTADDILAIPEIAEALEWWAVFKVAKPMEISTTNGTRKGLVLP